MKLDLRGYMDQIKVNTGDLQTSAQELDSVVNDINYYAQSTFK
jgi:hypothetical protein